MSSFGLETLRIGPEKNFCYLLYSKETRESAIFDGAFDFDKIHKKVLELKLNIKYLVATHGHWDHAGGLKDLKLRFPNAKVAFGEKDSDLVKKQGCHGDIFLKDGDELFLGNSKIKVIHTAGHTPGGCCFIADGYLLTGDTLFIGQCGRTDLQGGSDEELFKSLQTLKMLSLDLTVLPGHDYGIKPFDSLKNQVSTNPTLLAKSLDEFVNCP